ncbi:hypothetical protein EV363DRAFT_1582430 [Boletus edulis]|nr:hypothetical protein EV363DRAFT_1582430 [Boletus edulis]
MTTHDLQTVFLPSENLGSVGNYDPTVPLARATAKNPLLAGRLYLRASLSEMVKIRRLSENQNFDGDITKETRKRYDNLLRQQIELESFEKRSWLHKIFKPSMKRATRTFASNAFDLWDSTSKTSDKMERDLLSTHSGAVASVTTDSVAKDEQVSGVAVAMDINGPLTQEAIDTIRQAASILASIQHSSDQSSPDCQDGQTSSTDTTLVAEASSSVRSSISALPSSPGSGSSFSYLSFNVNCNVDPADPIIAELYFSEQDLVYPRQCTSLIVKSDDTQPSQASLGDLFFRATLNAILYLCKNLEGNRTDFLRETTAQYDNLGRRKRELELLNKRKSIFRPFLEIKRAKRAFHDDARALFVSTRTTSDRLKRNLISTSANLAPVQSETVKGNRVSGVVIPLPPQAEMNAPGIQEALPKSQDGQSSTASARFHSEASSSARSSIPTSPSSAPSVSVLNVNVNCNNINNTDSNAPGFTINNNSSETSGSSTALEHQSSADNAPS